MTLRRLTLVARLALAIAGLLATPAPAQSGRINALMSAGKYSEALPLAQGMVASLEKSNNGRELAAALNNLGQVYAGQGRDDLAEPLYERAIALMEKSLGLETSLISAELTNLAALYQRQGRLAEAEPLFKRTLVVSEKVLSREHPEVGRALHNLATLYVKQERQFEAEPLFQRALAIYQKAAGPEHPAVATVLNNIGHVYRDLNRDADAEAPIKRSLVIREKALGPDHPDVATSTSNLAYLLYVSGRTADALPLAEKTLANDRAQLQVVLPILFAARQQWLLPDDKAVDEALAAIQRGTQSSRRERQDRCAQHRNHRLHRFLARRRPRPRGSRRRCRNSPIPRTS